MSEMGEMFNALKAARQEKRASNRKSSPELLTAAGLCFESRNGGAHLIVTTARGIVDFWPGTGLWMTRGSNRRSYGVRSLVRAAISEGGEQV